MILVLDNRDSFTFNLVQALRGLGAEVEVAAAAAVDAAEVRRRSPAGVLVGPGPGRPEASPTSEAVLLDLSRDRPVLGVCLGHQALATACGGRVVSARELVHGETRPVEHDGRGVFRGLASPLALARYSSLAVEESSLPDELAVSARDAAGDVAGLRHTGRAFLESVQGHPESVLCVEAGGRALLANFLGAVRAAGRVDATTRPA